MGIGDFLAGAGNVGTGMRQAEQQAQAARLNQLAIQEENRRVAERREAARAGVAVSASPITVPSFVGGATAAPAPVVPAAAPAPGMTREQMLAHARQTMSPEDFAVFAYGQPGTAPAQPAAPAQAGVTPPPQPAAQPPTASAAPTQAGLAAPAPGSSKPVLRGAEGDAMLQQLAGEGFPMPPGPPQAGHLTEAEAIMPGRLGQRQGQSRTLPPDAKGNVFAPALDGITAEQFSAMSPAEQQRYVDMENAYRVTTRAAKTAAGVVTAGPRDVVRFGYDSLTALARMVGLDDFARSIGLMDPTGEARELHQDGGLKNTLNVDRMRRERSPLTAEQLAKELRARDTGKPVAEAPAEEPKKAEAKRPADAPKGPAASALQGFNAAGVSEGKGKAAEPVAPSTFYESNTKSLLADRKQLDGDYQRIREVLLKRAAAASRYGNVENLQQLEASVAMLDQQYKSNAMMLEGMVAVQLFEYGDDPSALGTVLSHYLNGSPVGFNRRDDGQWDLFIGENYNGTYGKGDISHMVKQFVDVNYRETSAASMSEAEMKRLENRLATNLELSKIEAQTLQSVIVESMRTKRALAVAQIGGKSYRVSMTQDGEIVRIESDSGETHIINPRSGEYVEGPGGMQIQVPPTTRPVTYQ